MSERPNFRNLIMLVNLMLPTPAKFIYTSDAKGNRQTHERAERTSVFSTGSQKLPQWYIARILGLQLTFRSGLFISMLLRYYF